MYKHKMDQMYVNVYDWMYINIKGSICMSMYEGLVVY